MTIGDDIRQKKFISEKQKALINVMYTYNHIVNELNIYFKQVDITRQQYNVLRILRGQYPNSVTINHIKDRMIDRMSDASRIVKRLRSKKLVTKTTSKKDKRVVEVKISQLGLDLLKNTDKGARKFEKLFDSLNDKETTTLNNLLDKVRNSN